MDTSAIVVIVVLTAFSLGAIIWLNIYGRRAQIEESPIDPIAAV